MQLYAAHGQVLCDARLSEQARADRGLPKIVGLIDDIFLVRHADVDAGGDDTSWVPSTVVRTWLSRAKLLKLANKAR
jgi:hypothetical protein